MKIKTLMFGITLAASLVTGRSQEFLIAAGSSSGTYKQMLAEISKTIGTETITFTEVESHGAVENLDLLFNNRCSGAFLHSDVLYFRARVDNLSKFKTLLALYQEEVHFLTLSQSKLFTTNSSGGTTVLGATFGATVTKTPIILNTVEDLKGKRVGAAGGGFITAQYIRLQSQIEYNVIQFDNGKQVMEALNNGLIEAAVFVGGAPLPNLKDLGKEYKLLPVTGVVADKLKAVYKPASVTYTKMSPNGVVTIAAECLLVAREYKTPKMIAQLRNFRDQFYAKLDELKETPGNHPKWEQVSQSEKGSWPWLELPLAK